jgi:hypothetical protein
MTVELSFDEGDLSLGELQSALEQLPSILDDKLADAATDIAQRLVGTARENAPVDTGQLRSSLEGATEQISETIHRVVVGSNLDSAGQMEYGTDPGYSPPVSELRDWARRVLGDESAAYPVARSISESGLDERRYLRDAFEEHLDWALQRWGQAIRAAFEEVGMT